ncbi:hypothetical protein IGI04_019371 [Brassica rapa subsp. trilocularis]|uniref:Uncharacterized protein n=1 Tax=Brassica rapa subsp. trilocularis TaxID=1813537 RepID=A0ABQ7MG15_BRACM|nr:hypothetical protein IGI04_019371 [Brassica rapa subsp. trilocularis]
MHAVRSLRINQVQAKLGHYVATERPSCSLGRYIAIERSSRSVATLRPSSSQARSLRSDRARPAQSLRSDRALVPLSRYIATELEPKLGRYVATELKPKLGRYVATELFRNIDTTPIHAFSSKPLMLSPDDRSELVKVIAPSRKTAQRDLKHDSTPILRFLNQKPVNRSTVYAWHARKDKCQVSADKYEIFCDSIRFSRLRVARTRNLADSSRAQAYTYRYPGPLGNYGFPSFLI